MRAMGLASKLHWSVSNNSNITALNLCDAFNPISPIAPGEIAVYFQKSRPSWI